MGSPTPTSHKSLKTRHWTVRTPLLFDSLIQRDDVGVSGVLPGQPDGQIVGFGTGIDEEADGQRFGHFRHDLFGAHH